MRKSLCIVTLATLALVCQGQTTDPTPVVVTGPVVVSEVGDMETAVSWFLDGLEWGSGIAALLFGFMSVRRGLSLGDAWND